MKIKNEHTNETKNKNEKKNKNEIEMTMKTYYIK
jgi:hypothetical protein